MCKLKNFSPCCTQSRSQSPLLLTAHARRKRRLWIGPILRWSWLVNIWNVIQYNKSAICGLLEPVLSRAFSSSMRRKKLEGSGYEIVLYYDRFLETYALLSCVLFQLTYYSQLWVDRPTRCRIRFQSPLSRRSRATQGEWRTSPDSSCQVSLLPQTWSP